MSTSTSTSTSTEHPARSTRHSQRGTVNAAQSVRRSLQFRQARENADAGEDSEKPHENLRCIPLR
jgi:hypothetical protein